MVKEISKGLKWTFLIYFVVSLIFGVLLFFLVEKYLEWFGIVLFYSPIVEIFPNLFYGGLFGGALLAFAIASFFAWREIEWEKVKIVMIMNIVWNMLGAFIFFWVTFLKGWPVHPMTLMHLILFFGFLATFIFFYIQHEKEQPVPRNDTEPIRVAED
ncbi:MAG: hypothetical protein ACFE88_16800 [Candidatus Hermodarchaeota archaeon]